jgi:elongation factor G
MRPIVSVAISPRTHSDLQRLEKTLIELSEQDPTFKVKSYLTESQIILSGMGYLQLEVICERIQLEHKIEIDVGTPSVIYLETIRKQAEGEGKYVCQTSGHGQYAHVKLRLEPRESASGYQFVNEITNGAVSAEFVEPVNFGDSKSHEGRCSSWPRDGGSASCSLRR